MHDELGCIDSQTAEVNRKPCLIVGCQARRKQIWNIPAVLHCKACVMFWGTPHHKLFCSQITCLKALSLNLVVAFMPENEALLPVFFIIFATVMAHIFTIYCKQFTVVFPNLPSPGTFFRQQNVLVSIPQQESFVMHKAYFHVLVSRIFHQTCRTTSYGPAIGTWLAIFYNMTITWSCSLGSYNSRQC